MPGIVGAWDAMAKRWGRLPLLRVLAPAIRLARGGMTVGPRLARAVAEQRPRLLRGGAGGWALLATSPGRLFVQLELADTLDRIGKDGGLSFYAGDLADWVAAAVQAHGGALTRSDLEAHTTVFAAPVRISWRGISVSVQPPMSQGVMLAMALQAMERLGTAADDLLDHAGIEATEAAFEFRDRIGDGEALLDADLQVDLTKAARRGGPRAYLHTAGVTAADGMGMTTASLASVFDDFGSGIFVPQGGFVLNNRAGGFTSPPNDAAPGKRPVHTLSPIIVETARGPIGLATPGADGQVQTLLQVMLSAFATKADLAAAVSGPRWRSEDGRLLVEADHPGIEALRSLGHDVVPSPPGNIKFGAVVCAGQIDGAPVGLADWRRETWAGVT